MHDCSTAITAVIIGLHPLAEQMSHNESGDSNYADCPVPLNERRGPFTMGLLWISMITAFPTVLIGFEWYKNGFTLPQVLLGTLLSCGILLLYSVPAAQLGARTGLSYTTLSRSIFGRWGSRLITVNLICMFIVFYGLTALFMSESLVGLFHMQTPVAIVTVCTAIVMSVNNFFGFKGVANFARYIAAPVIILWVIVSFAKAVVHCPPSVFTQVPHQSFALAMTSISSFVIGFAIWGNECDYWRFSRPKVSDSIIPLSVAMFVGQIAFPVTGWMVAQATGVTEYGAATELMTKLSFGGISLIAALVLGSSYFASNDSNLFGSLQACENLKKISHQKWAAALAIAGAIAGAMLSVFGAAKAIESIACLNCIIMPTPTVIMMVEWFLCANIFKQPLLRDNKVPDFDQLPTLPYPSICALVAGVSVGLLTAGVIPGTEKFAFGISSVQSWLTAIAVYVPLRILEFNQSKVRLQSLEKQLDSVLHSEPKFVSDAK